MRMPGFTAEASLAKTHEYYGMRETLRRGAGGGKAVPQMQICEKIWCIGSYCAEDCHEALE
jgi:hypothetical protein